MERQVVSAATTRMMKKGQAIMSCQLLKAEIKESQDVEVSRHLVNDVVRNDMRLTYRRPRKIPDRANSERCCVFR